MIGQMGGQNPKKLFWITNVPFSENYLEDAKQMVIMQAGIWRKINC